MKTATSGSDSQHHATFASRILPPIAGALFLCTGFSVQAANLTVDGAQRFQTIDGMGVNINVNSWNNGQLKPALDFLVTVNGSTLFRVARDPMDWVSSETMIPALHALDPSTLQQVYETEKMQDIWNTICYLNQKGIGGRQIILSFMGWTPAWIGGSGTYGVASYIAAGKEQEFATMVASLIYYGKKVKGLDFTYLSPMNEEDWNCLEGPCVGTTQYTTIMHNIADELNYMGIIDVRFVGPETADMGTGRKYIRQMMTDGTVAGLTDHFALHVYSGPVIPGISYPGKNSWLTETSAWCSSCDAGGDGPPNEWSFATQTTDLILGDINNGFSAVLLWEAYDSFWYHHNASSLWGLLAYNPVSGIYTPRTRAYAYAQFNHFVGPGDVVIGSNNSIGGVPTTVAVYNATTGKIAIIGRNSGSWPITINGQLSNLPEVNALTLYETSSSDNLARRSDVPVAGGVFTAQISADAIFTLTNQPISFDLAPPTITITSPPTAAITSPPTVAVAPPLTVAITSPLSGTATTGTIKVTATTSNDKMVAGLRFVLDGANIGQELATPPYSINLDTTMLAKGGHALSAIARDPAGNVTMSTPVSFTVNAVAAQQASSTIWPDTAVPGLVDTGPDNAVELGVKFRSDTNGFITGIRFYKADTNTGPHVGNLWTSTGTLLASAAFTEETASGWQQVNFPTPVAITANSVYMASYHTSVGHYSYNLSYFSGTGMDSPPLHALADGVSGINGMFSYGTASSFPNQGASASNYWVDVAFSPIAAAPTTTSSIWPGTAVPVEADTGPDNAVELGVKFRSDTNGYITGIRFYKASTNTGTHIGNLWTGTGTLLATATFTNETASGWQQVNFSTPAAITADMVYVASYHTNAGHYSDDQNYFTSKGVDNPPLHALANEVSGVNGVYAYGSTSSFPINGWNSSNYWVDVVFQQ